MSGLPAVELRFTWKGSSGLVDQRLVMCATGKRLVLSITSTVPRASGVDMEATMNRILASVSIPGVRGDGAMPPATPRTILTARGAPRPAC